MREREGNSSIGRELTNPPSIGSKDLSFDIAGNRVRQIVEKIVGSNDELSNILRKAENFAASCGATRTIVRVLIENGLLVDMADGFQQEAKIPLAGKFSGLSLVYYGFNNQGRHSSVDILKKEATIMENVLKRPPKIPSSIFEQTRGFSPERLRGELNMVDYKRLREMYSLSFTAYPFDIEESIRSMARSEGYVVYVARSKVDGLLYAVCATEEMVLNVEGIGRFVMREMGDSAKIPQVNGLNSPLKLLLIKKAFEDEVDLVFCESRAALPQVNAVNHDIGMHYSGFLMQHTRIGGDGIDEKSPYGNMNVWALNKDGIQRIGQEVKLLTS